MKFAWLTDIHLNFLTREQRQKFYQEIIDAEIDCVVISGDIAEAPNIEDILTEMAHALQKPIYFVLGNHDYYRGEVSKVREKIETLTQQSSWLHWLPSEEELQQLTHDTLLVGEDCWADGRYGDYAKSQVMLNDSRMIYDLHQGSILGKFKLLDAMQQLADSDAKRLKHNLERAIKSHSPKKIIIVTHIPPFKESCIHEGIRTNDDFLPFFSSKATGDVILEIAQQNKEITFLALCGHTHSESYFKACPNLTVKAGGSEYMQPKIQEVIEI